MKKILDVGQCDHDHGLMTALAKRANAQIVRSSTANDALEKLRAEKFHLIWVNRMLDADNTFGIELVKTLKADAQLKEIPVMLISNFVEARTAAQALGALPGFGKEQLKDPATLQAVQQALGE